jgi:Fe2+ transport system protein FeoA
MEWGFRMNGKEDKLDLKPVTRLKKGQEGIIVMLDTDDGSMLKKLMSMGVLPGVTFKMLQSYPAYVFQAGYTRLAVDKEIASVIIIKINGN